MKMNIKILRIVIITISILLLLSISVYAYSWTYVTASGSVSISCGIPEASVEKYEENNIKKFIITNIGEWDCFVRVKIFGIGLTNSMLQLR